MKIADWIFSKLKQREHRASLTRLCTSARRYAKLAGCSPENAISHYEKIGWKMGINPHVLFDTKFVIEEYHDGEPFGSPFDLYYRAICAGKQRGASPFFNLQWYSDNNPDVMIAGVDPYLHYLEYGAREGRQPNPWYALPPFSVQSEELFEQYETLDEYLKRDTSAFVSTSWLTEVYDLPEDGAHEAFWRMRANGFGGWPMSQEKIFGGVAQLASDLPSFRKVLKSVIEFDSRKAN